MKVFYFVILYLFYSSFAVAQSTLQIIVSEHSLSITEGGSRSFNVRLSSEPATDVRVRLSRTNSDVTVSPVSLTFTSSNARTNQTVTVRVAEDSDYDSESDTITLSGTGPNKTVSVSINDNDTLPEIVVLSGSFSVNEGGSRTFNVKLSSQPTGNVNVTLSKTNSDVTLNPSSLTFTSSNWNTSQSVTVSVAQDDDYDNESDTITLSGSGTRGNNTFSVSITDDDERPTGPTNPTVSVNPEKILINEEGRTSFEMRLNRRPTNPVTAYISNKNEDLVISPREVTFTENNWKGVQFTLSTKEDSNRVHDRDTIVISSLVFDDKFVPVLISDKDIPHVKAHVLAIPNTRVQDISSIRVRCLQGSEACEVLFDCGEQETGESFIGWTEPIAPRKTRVFMAQDIESLTGNRSWEKRLGCTLRSDHDISAQIWTRSGDGVLVNNSQFISSVKEGIRYRADVESITSPTSNEKSNIRIRCKGYSDREGDCTRTELACYTDKGRRYNMHLGTIPYLTVRHLQAQEIATSIFHTWEGQGLTCEVRSEQPFTVQVLTRTGGGGALVNNSAN